MVWCFDLSTIRDRIISHKGTELSFHDNQLQITIEAQQNQFNSSGFMLAWATTPEAFYKLKVDARLETGDKAFVFVETSDYSKRLVPRTHWIYQGTALKTEIIFQAVSEQTLLGILFNQANLDYRLTVTQFELSSKIIEDNFIFSEAKNLNQTRVRPLETATVARVTDTAIVEPPKTLTQLALTRLEALQAKQLASLPKPVAPAIVTPATPATPKVVEMNFTEKPITPPEKKPPQVVETPKISVSKAPEPPVSKTKSPDFFNPTPPSPDFQASSKQIRIRRVSARFKPAGQPSTLLTKFAGRIYVVIEPDNMFEFKRDYIDFQLRARYFDYFLVKGLLPDQTDYQKQIQTQGLSFSQQIPDARAWARQQTYLKVLEDANRQRSDKILILEPDLRFHSQLEKQIQLALSQPETLQAPLVFLGYDQTATRLSAIQEQSKFPFFYLETNFPIQVPERGLAVMISQQLYQSLIKHWQNNGIRNRFTLALETQALKLKSRSLVFNPPLVCNSSITNLVNADSINYIGPTLTDYQQWRFDLQSQNFSIRQALFSAPDQLDSSHLNSLPVPPGGWGPVVQLLEHFNHTTSPNRLAKMNLINLLDGYPLPMAIVVPSYNNAKNYQRNLDSIFAQDYLNYRVIYVDDCSTDQTHQLVTEHISQHKQNGRVTLYRQAVNQKQAAARYWAYNQTYPDEVVILLDGDDWFPHDQVLSLVDLSYQRYQLLASYGSFYTYINQKTDWNDLNGQGTFPQKIIDKKRYRHYRWTSQHLRTAWGALFHQIRLADLWHSNGRFITTSTDCAESYPLLEMADKHHQNIGITHKTGLYVYNQSNSLMYDNSYYNQKKAGNQDQKDYRLAVQNLLQGRPIYPTIDPKLRFQDYPEFKSRVVNLKINLIVTAELWPIISPTLPSNWTIIEQQRVWSDQIPDDKPVVTRRGPVEVNLEAITIETNLVEENTLCPAGPPGPKGLRRVGAFYEANSEDSETDIDGETKSRKLSEIDKVKITSESVNNKKQIASSEAIEVWVRIVEQMSLSKLSCIIDYISLPADQTLFLDAIENPKWSDVSVLSRWLRRTRADTFHLGSGRLPNQGFVYNLMTPAGHPDRILAFTFKQPRLIPLSLDGLYRTTSLKTSKFQIGLTRDSPLGDPVQITIDQAFKSIKAQPIEYTNQAEPVAKSSEASDLPKSTSETSELQQNNSNSDESGFTLSNVSKSRNKGRSRNPRIAPRLKQTHNMQYNGIGERPSLERVIRIRPAANNTRQLTIGGRPASLSIPGIQTHYVQMKASKKA